MELIEGATLSTEGLSGEDRGGLTHQQVVSSFDPGRRGSSNSVQPLIVNLFTLTLGQALGRQSRHGSCLEISICPRKFKQAHREPGNSGFGNDRCPEAGRSQECTPSTGCCAQRSFLCSDMCCPFV